MWIKKNGKVVYAADPAALGAAMGWDGTQIADLAAASNEFMQIATLYMGTASQMPDPVIEAVEGMGNVAPNRDLAYIVLENEDLTDMQGAVSQFEFCVFAGAARSYTTPPYPVYAEDSLSAGSVALSGVSMRQPRDFMDVTSVALGGDVQSIRKFYTAPVENLDVTSIALGGEIEIYDPVRPYTTPPEELTATSVALGGERQTVRLFYTNYDPEELSVTSVALGGTIE